ncbi:MAG: CHAT domain-containing protein [Minicystis sp.]
MRLWISTPAGTRPSITVDGQPRSAEGLAVQGGTLVTIEVPEGARAVTVSAAQEGARPAAYVLTLVPRATDPALDEAAARRAEGKPDAARALLEALLGDPRPAIRAQAVGKLARVERAGGATERAIAHFREAIRLAHESGRAGDEIFDRFALAYTLVFSGRRFTEAREVLDGVRPLASIAPDRGAQAPYHRGLIAQETGDLRAAIRLFDEAAMGAERFGLDDVRLDAMQVKADVLATIGRPAEALALLEEVDRALAKGDRRCRRADLLNDLGWLSLRAASSAGAPPGLPDPGPRFAEALALYREACPSPDALANVLTNLALAELDRGHADRARAHLDEARRARPDASPRLAAWWPGIEARVALLEGRREDALAAYNRMRTAGARAGLPEVELDGAAGHAAALEALGRSDEARAAHAETESLLDRWSLAVPLGEGRETFFARHEPAARRHVTFLVREARAAARTPSGEAAAARLFTEAAARARRSHARILAAVQQIDRVSTLSPPARARWERAVADYKAARAALDDDAAADWTRSADALAASSARRAAEQSKLRAALDEALAALGPARAAPADPAPPAERELQLTFHPVEGGWAGFATTARGTVARDLGPIDVTADPARLAVQLLDPFRDLLREAARIRLAPYGPLQRIDLHALPFEGRPLFARAPVVYGADLPRPPTPEAKLAVVVGDPLDDLPAARREARAVAGALEARGLRVVRLEGAAATHAAVRAAIEASPVALFHYAGHGRFEGRDGWESGLLLAGGGELTIGDIVALARVPNRVILSGCETARAGRAEGLGIAQAFLAAGSTAVIAAARRVNGRLAEDLVRALYAPSSRSFPNDLAAALAEAQVAVLASTPDADAASFRALSP